MKGKNGILLGILIIAVVCLTTGCFYNLVDSKTFKDHFAALGYTVSDSEEARYEADTYLVASKSDVPYAIEYYEFKDEIEAKKVYEKYKDSIIEFISSTSDNTETTGAVFSKTVAVSEKEYIVISRVKNTLIFINGTNDYSKEIDKLLEDIEY